MENLVFDRLAFKAMMSENAVAEDDSKDKEVSDADMANLLTTNVAKKLSTKRDKSGKPAITKLANDPQWNNLFSIVLILKLF